MHNDIATKELRSFGLIVGGIFGVIGVGPALWHGEGLRMWALVLAGVLTIPALLVPRSLKPVHGIWMAIGHILGRINTAIILGVVFYGVVTPMGLVMRLMGRDPMCRRFEPDTDTYCVTQQPRPAGHMTRQF